MNPHFSQSNRRADRQNYCPDGFTVVELLVAATLLSAVMVFSTTLFHRIHLTLRDIQHQQIAVGELASQLGRITLENPEDIEEILSEIKLSTLCREALREPLLTGESFADELGVRVTLKLSWQRVADRPSVELSGWVIGDQANE